MFRINPDNLFKQNEKLYLENAIESSKNAYKKLKILDLNIEDDKYPQFGSKDTISNNIKSLPVKLKEKTKRNLTNVASYAEETLRRKQEHTRDRCYQVSDDFGPFLSVFYADSRGLVSAFTKLNI